MAYLFNQGSVFADRRKSSERMENEEDPFDKADESLMSQRISVF